MLDLDVPSLVIAFLVLIFSLTVHEAAHAWSASRLGDDTARRLGRVSLNPVVHTDPIGTLLLPLIAMVSNAPIIGWAKPTPVNVRNLRQPRRDHILVTAAGPASNLLIATAASLTLRMLPGAGSSAELDVITPVTMIATQALLLNVLLAVFNMLPVPPLDGGNVLAGLVRGPVADAIDRLRPYGFLILYGLMFSGILWTVVQPIQQLVYRLLGV